MKILTFTGWGQQELPIPQSHSFSFLSKPDIEAAWKHYTGSTQPDIIIAWSLGGAVAVTLLQEEKLKTQQLILLATPFQFIDSPKKQQAINELKKNYQQDPRKTLKRFQQQITFGDSKTREVRSKLVTAADTTYLENWLPELEHVNFTNKALDKIPNTLIIQGNKDIVVNKEQAEKWSKSLPNCTICTLPEAGHAPHLHHPESIESVIKKVEKNLLC